ncbi:MAG TPA: lipid A 3-O-deacylase [Rhodanobacteraceae bacterium]|nr:lipid A 3-O-deacylase [Rhodanobacteraceae bacterium]
MSAFAKNRRVHGWLLAAFVLAALLACIPRAAARVELSGGRSMTLHHDWTTVFFAEWIGDARPWWKFNWAPAIGLGHFNARTDLPNARLDNDVWVGAAGARLYLWRGAFFGFQVAATDGKTDALSTPYEFVSSLGWQGAHWQLVARHVSNGDFHKPNHGETMLLAGVAF